MDQHPPIFVITGQLAAGESTLAKALLARFEFGYHVDVDGMREMVTSGLASPLEWTDETTRGGNALQCPSAENVMREIDADLVAQTIPSGWHRIDNGDQSVEATVEQILSFAQ